MGSDRVRFTWVKKVVYRSSKSLNKEIIREQNRRTVKRSQMSKLQMAFLKHFIEICLTIACAENPSPEYFGTVEI